MEKLSLFEDRFSRLDFQGISKIIESSCRLLNNNLELRNPQGRVILSYPVTDNSLLSNINFEEHFYPHLRKGEIKQLIIENNQYLIALPVMKEGHFIGALIISNPKGENSKTVIQEKIANSLSFYQSIADFIAKEYAAQLEVLSLSEELANRYEELNLFYKVGEWLKGVQETAESIQLIVDKLIDTLEVDYGFITLPSRETFVVSGFFDHWQELKDKERYLKELGEELLKIFLENELIILDQVHEHQTLKSYFPPSLSLMAVPISINNVRQGALGISYMTDLHQKKFTTGDLRLLHSMAEVISILLKNTELYHNLKSFLVNVVKCLVSAIEAKDIYTRGHSERVNYISMLIANYMNLPLNVRESINWASMLHDIGKIGIPEAILTKADKLTDGEFAEIRKHPERGYIILKPIQGFQSALDGVRFHQERYDGKGYPNGLKSKDIPLSARIISIADTYDAITTSRAYRKGLSHEDAIAEIKRVAGTQLDPELVYIFLNLIESKGDSIFKEELFRSSYEG